MNRTTPHRWLERAQLKSATRQFFEKRGFLELDTPLAVVCPGTEVHLQYFETSWADYKGNHHKLFLRSSPELHMKRALAAGCQKIYQVGPCFRSGGELSEWHQPEFSMLEWYEMGQSYQGLIDTTEAFLRETAEVMARTTRIPPSKILPHRFERLSVFDAFKEFVNVDLIDNDTDLSKKCIAAGLVSVQVTDNFETTYFKALIEKIEPALERKNGVVLMDYPPSQAALSVVKGGRACRFEFYVGRVELCNGFYELTGEQSNRLRVKEAMSDRLKAGRTLVPSDEEFFLDMDKLHEPYAGNALGFDRWLALLCGEKSLDQVIPFRRSGVYKDQFTASDD